MAEGGNALPLVLIVGGAPGTGKTTLARKLAPALGLPLIARDDLKESLFETLGWSTVEWSQQLGRATYELVYLLIERLLEAQCSLLVETPFDPDWANPRFQALRARHPFQPAQVILSTPAELLRQRYARRVDNGERHPGMWIDCGWASSTLWSWGSAIVPWTWTGRYSTLTRAISRRWILTGW